VGESAGSAGGSKRQLAARVHDLVSALGLTGLTLVGHDVGGMIAYSYLRQYADAAQVVIMDTVIPGIDPWQEVLRNPHIWHFALHAIPALPETLVQGRQAEYFDFFYNVLSADPSRITPRARRVRQRLPLGRRTDRGVRLLPGVCPGRPGQRRVRQDRRRGYPAALPARRTRKRQHRDLRRRIP